MEFNLKNIKQITRNSILKDKSVAKQYEMFKELIIESAAKGLSRIEYHMYDPQETFVKVSALLKLDGFKTSFSNTKSIFYIIWED